MCHAGMGGAGKRGALDVKSANSEVYIYTWLHLSAQI